jgi:hypothetical protein
MKQQLRDMLVARDFDGVADLAVKRKRALGILISLTYDVDELVAWRAVEAMGVASGRAADDNAEVVRNILRRLHWLLLEESGGVGWYAPQMMAEIIRARPALFRDDFASVATTLLHTMAEDDLGHFRPGILWAIGRLAAAAPDDVAHVLPEVEECLDHDDAQVRGMAVWCLTQVGGKTALAARAELRSDDGAVQVYEDGQLVEKKIGELAVA